MTYYTPLHDLIFGLLPPVPVRIGPAEIITTFGATGLAWFEWRTWRKHR